MIYPGVNDMSEIPEIKFNIQGKPVSGLLNEPFFLNLIKVIPELKTLLVGNVFKGFCSSPATFQFQVNSKYAEDVEKVSVKLMALGYKVNIL